MFDVYVDSAANIPAEIVKEYGIHVISFHTFVDGKMIEDFDCSLSPEEERALGHTYYEAIRNGSEVKTSLVNQAEFMEPFEKTLKEGKDILYISLSKNISGTYNAAKLAAEDLAEEYPNNHVYLVDSLNASLAQGILALYAVEKRDKGQEIQSIQKELSAMALQMNGVFTVGSLKYLSKTGRISGAKALIGNALKIKPILRGNKEGFIVQFRKCRGRK
ncbi:MAG: DegV family protein, partial [Eubacteriales bacterium]|nr:DegV family protein [Eubacteriales bacterium]